MRHLDVSANGLSGPLPASMGKLEKLEVLYLGESGLEVRNNLSGKIPRAWSGMTSLARLSLSGNNLIKGKFPTWLGALTRLEELTVSGASLSGEVPETVGECARLRLLDASGNKLRGGVPEGNTERLAQVLFSEYLLPFEIASFLLLAAIVGSVLITKRRLR